MKSSVTTNELVYYSATKDRKINFSGNDSSLSIDKRFDFLKHYKNHARKWYNDEDLNQKAADMKEVKSFLDGYAIAKPHIRKVLSFDTMTAYTADMLDSYKNFKLYCGAQIIDGELIMSDRKIRTNPCIAYNLENPSEELCFKFEVYISKEYKCAQDKKSGQGQAGRSIELRVGTLDKANIRIYNTGEVISLSGNMWTPKFTVLGNVNFDSYNTIEIIVGKDVKFSVNGVVTENIACSADGKIDNIFFGGGMHPRGLWKLKNLELNDEKIVLQRQDIKEESLNCLGEVTLPYAIGTYKNKDKRLYLTKKFNLDKVEDALLCIETLDPCGKVWVNDALVLDTFDFMKHEIDVSKVLKIGENEIKILVEPRPPEVYYYWHRHSDCYNGWFCGCVSLSLGDKLSICNMKAETYDVRDGVKGEISVDLKGIKEGEIEFFASQIYPESGREISIGKTKLCSDKIKYAFSGDFKLWSCENPILYSVRAELSDKQGAVIDDFVIETGFRTVEQKDGAVYVNNEKTLLFGALLMQFLPPLENVPVNHNCPSLEEIVWQSLMLKNMNGNLMRLHLLGYGTNDARFARVCDRLGIMLIWTTRFIDSAESLIWEGKWQEAEEFQKQMTDVINHPSIIIWEGSNEYHPKSLEVIDRMCDEFVSNVKKADTTRLICPCSHLYYGGGLYDIGCKYYNDDGTLDEKGERAISGKGWTDEKVIRSTHTYILLCGYGETWEAMRNQDWRWQDEMLQSKHHSYHITEYAITALANPNTPEALANEYVESYERIDEEGVFGRHFEQSEWMLSQAYQALCTQNAVKLMRSKGVDGMMWCCLTSGANNGSYLKPPIDFYGYKKLGFYALREVYQNIYASKSDVNVSFGTEDEIEPIILNSSAFGKYNLCVTIIDEDGNAVDKAEYTDINVTKDDFSLKLKTFSPKWQKEGYYTIKYELEKKD